jgi:hypothetical protein
MGFLVKLALTVGLGVAGGTGAWFVHKATDRGGHQLVDSSGGRPVLPEMTQQPMRPRQPLPQMRPEFDENTRRARRYFAEMHDRDPGGRRGGLRPQLPPLQEPDLDLPQGPLPPPPPPPGLNRASLKPGFHMQNPGRGHKRPPRPRKR